MEGLQVDGNDVVAVRCAAERALDKARGGGGPTLIEALTYRLADHTTADDASRYRSDEEVSKQWEAEPVARLRAYLMAEGVWSKEDEERLQGECSAQVEAAASEYLEIAAQHPASMFEHLYGTLPADLVGQRHDLDDPVAHGEEDG